jgi:hypothetical protein
VAVVQQKNKEFFGAVGTQYESFLDVGCAALAFIYLVSLFNHADEYPDLLRFPPFLATIGLLLYSLTSYFYYATFDILLAKNNYQFFMIAHLIAEVGCAFIYTFLGFAFLCFTRVKKID